MRNVLRTPLRNIVKDPFVGLDGVGVSRYAFHNITWADSQMRLTVSYAHGGA